MSLFPNPISAGAAAASVAPVSSTPRATRATPSASAADSEAVTVDTMPASPPPEVLDEIGAAAGAYDRLAASGQHLSFASDPTAGGLSVQVTDLAGNVLGAVSPSTVLQVAAGAPLN